MRGFAKRWRRDDQPLLSKVRDRITSSKPLKSKIAEAERKIKIQMNKIDLALSRIAERDSYIFRKVVMALQRKDPQQASVYANELSEVRKLGKLVTQANLALQQVTLRLNTVRDLGDAVTVLSPAISVVRNVGSNLSYIIPEAQGEISEINNILGDILIDAGELSGNTYMNTETTNEEADKILSDASTLAEKRMKQLFPEISTPQLRRQTEEIGV
ncbi:MAG: Snf7 family protein [Nitrososphaerales archaeon]